VNVANELRKRKYRGKGKRKTVKNTARENLNRIYQSLLNDVEFYQYEDLIHKRGVIMG
jgi:hypothetical protein